MLAHGQGEQINLPAGPVQRSPTSATSAQSEGTSSKSLLARRTPVAQALSKQPKLGESTVLDIDTSLPALWRKYRDAPVSWMAARWMSCHCQRAIGISISRMCRVLQRARLSLSLPCLGTFLGGLSISSWSHWKSSIASTLSMILLPSLLLRTLHGLVG